MEVATSASLLHPLHLRAKRREPQLVPSPSATFLPGLHLRGGASRVCIGRRWTYSAPPRQRYLLFKTNALKGEGEVPDVVGGRILAGSMVTVALAVANRVLYKLALVPMKDYPFFLAQTFLVWQLIFSVLILGRRYSYNQVFGCLLIAVGVVLAVASGANEGQFLSEIGLLWPALMIASSAFQAGASILKEFVFIDGAKRLQGKPLDILVVNSFGSGFQALFVFLLLPLLSNLRGIPFTELPTYLKNGAGCFFNAGYSKMGRKTIGCEGAPLLQLLFIATNMAFNILLLNLIKMPFSFFPCSDTIRA